jgi:glycosyltransferase involved in cell wall biosynthesis
MSNDLSSQVVVSVVCITYNHEKYIRSALEGFLIQNTPFSVEFIVSDDCSPDGTMDVVSEYFDRFDGRLRVIRNPSNIGFMRNLMNAMDMAKGKYIAICEGDDYWTDPEKLSIQVEKMDKVPGVEISFHSSKIKYEVGGKLDSLYCKRANSDCLFGIEDVIRSAGSFMPTASMMIRGEAYRGLLSGIRALYSSYTTAFFTQLIFSFRNGALYIDRPMSVYRSMASGSWTESIVNDPDVYISWSNRYLNAIRAFDQLTDHKHRVAFERAISSKHFSILKHPGISLDYRKKYFNKSRAELTAWQTLLWGGIRYFPLGVDVSRKVKAKMIRAKEVVKGLRGS